MKEARIIMPASRSGPTDEVKHFGQANAWLQRQLAATFGGYTMTSGQGAWEAPSGQIETEPVNVYDVAMVDIPANRKMLTKIATELLDRGKQQSIYVRMPSGEVSLIARERAATQPSKDEQNWLDDMIERHNVKEIA